MSEKVLNKAGKMWNLRIHLIDPFNALVAWSGKRKKGRGWHDPSHDYSVELSTESF